MKNTDQILTLLSQHENYFSGQELAKRLNISRTAVWKAVKSLQEQGHMIESRPHQGYRYLDSNTLNSARIKYYLAPQIDLDLLLFDSLPSTNLKAKELSLTTNKRPLVVLADQQTEGYGRYRRQFISPKGTGIYLSLLLDNSRLDFDPGLLTTATAVALTRTLEQLFELSPQIKWVNDIIVSDKKVCGILTEGITDLETRSLNQVVVGCGINFLTDPKTFPSELQQRAGSLRSYVLQTELSRNRFIATFLNNFFSLYADYYTGAFMAEYKAHSNVIGHHVTIIQGQKEFSAFVSDINTKGELVLQDGTCLASGEVTKIRPK